MTDKSVGDIKVIIGVPQIDGDNKTGNSKQQTNGGGAGVNILTAPQHSEEALALMFAERHAESSGLWRNGINGSHGMALAGVRIRLETYSRWHASCAARLPTESTRGMNESALPVLRHVRPW
jgi:hypothetical protein